MKHPIDLLEELVKVQLEHIEFLYSHCGMLEAALNNQSWWSPDKEANAKAAAFREKEKELRGKIKDLQRVKNENNGAM